MGAYEIVWAKGIEKDFKKLNFGQERFKKLVEKLSFVHNNPYKYTKQILASKGKKVQIREVQVVYAYR